MSPEIIRITPTWATAGDSTPTSQAGRPGMEVERKSGDHETTFTELNVQHARNAGEFLSVTTRVITLVGAPVRLRRRPGSAQKMNGTSILVERLYSE
jgi:hypothetical protein